MDRTETTNNTAASPQTQPAFITLSTRDQATLSRFDQMVERMKGTGRIVGDIISPDTEIWTCEIE